MIWGRRWSVGIEGLESGRVTELTFMRFWRRSSAEAWVRRMNRKLQPVTRYVVIDRTRLPSPFTGDGTPARPKPRRPG